ncbi:LPXTG-motif cell wall anchor domain-containing protein OS=Streptomyces microflavus OX=1919 GN=Smic_29770 PE=4 SV=1 [Streptomyces microflavus]
MRPTSPARRCPSPTPRNSIGDKNATSPVRISAKKNGGAYDLTVTFSASVMDSPIDIPAEQVKPSMDVKLAGRTRARSRSRAR